MHYRGFVLLAFNFVLFRSEAFVVPIQKANVVERYLSVVFAQKDDSTPSFKEGRIAGLENKLPIQSYDASPQSDPLRQIETALAPAAEFLDTASDGWALSYADLSPNSERTLPGQVFLATNIAYTAVGLFLSLQGEVLLGFFTEICSAASFCYHYAQLQVGVGRTQDSTVRLALLVDYILAITSILIGLFYLVFDRAVPPPEGIASAILGIVCLFSCWVWEKGLPYIILHGLWHLFSAASAYYIGIAHATT